MMESIKDVIHKVYRNVLEETRMENDQGEGNVKVDRASGLNSLEFVNLIVGIEEELKLNLDPVLIDLRKTKRLSEVITIIENLSAEKNINSD
jgi:acyl carrier protein